MKIAFIDHPLHRKTRSSDFFIEILRQRSHEVEIFYPGSEWRFVVDEVEAARCDLAVCWQHEFYAPALVARGLRTIIIPMYDGAGGMPPQYWRFFARLGIEALNFSENLHQQHLRAGIVSTYVQYFPDPEKFVPVEDFSALRGFLWQRRPDHYLHWHTAIRLTCGQLSHLHIHDVPDTRPPPDVPQTEDWPLIARTITRSTWLETREEFLDLLRRSNVFIAPRLNEGIGLALLEAMAQGQCVIAHNDSTHNEYIEHGKHGLLFSLHNPCPLDLSNAATLARNARERISFGHQKWLADQETLTRRLENIATAKIKPLTSNVEKVALSFPFLYFKGMRLTKEKLAKLRVV
jgi:hypothetical protein